MARWVESLHGSGDLPEALQKLNHLVGAVEATLLRLPKGSGRVRRIVDVTGSGAGAPGLNLAELIAPHLIELTNESILDGSLWSMTDALKAGDLKLPIAQEIRIKEKRLGEVLIVSLENRTKHIELLELHFRSAPAEHNRLLLTAMAPEISNTWKRRLRGTVQKLLSRPNAGHNSHAAEPAETQDILHPDNPMSLSRSEFRICLMMRDGMKVKDITDALSICEATVRSHLSAIYSKTSSSGQLELVHRLNKPGRTEHAQASRVA